MTRLREIVGPTLPMVAIGGLKTTNIPDVIRAGADGVAVVSAICSAASPAEATRQLLNCVKQAKR